MTDNERLTCLIQLLNIKDDTPFVTLRKFLWENGLCDFIAIVGDKEYSLFTKKEANSLQEPPETGWEGNHSSWIVKHAASGDEIINRAIIFPEEDNDSTGTPRAKNFIEHFTYRIVGMFQEFICKCNDGFVDISLLNKYLETEGMTLSFIPSKSPLRPSLNIWRMTEGKEDIALERRIMDKLIYPFLFSGQAHLFSKIRNCRNCRTFFLGKRLSATFCSDKCRGAFHHANA